MFSNERRRERAAEAEEAAKVACRARIEEALAPYERAMAVAAVPTYFAADVIDLRETAPVLLSPPIRLRRRNRPLVYVAAQS